MADTEWHIEELLFRGRPAGSALPVSFHVLVQERVTLADGRSSILQEKTLTPEQAATAGFDVATITAWIDTEMSADLTQTRETLALMTQDRDAWMAQYAVLKKERDALAADAAMAAVAAEAPVDKTPSP